MYAIYVTDQASMEHKGIQRRFWYQRLIICALWGTASLFVSSPELQSWH